MLENPSTSHPDFDESWRRIESLVEEIAQWSKAAESLSAFYGVLLQRTVAELRVTGGAVWTLDPGQRLQRTDMLGSPLIDVTTQRPAHLAHVQRAFDVQNADVDAPQRGEENRWKTVISNDDDGGLISCFAPVVVDAETVAVVELLLSAETSTAERENVEHVLAALADVAIDFHRADQLRTLRGKVASWDAAQVFSDCVHRRLDLDETCYAIANDGRRFVEVDRISLFVGHARSLRLRAISGVEAIDRRSPDVMIMRKLAQAVALYGEPLSTQGAIDQPPQIQQLLDAYQDATGVRCLAVVPITSEPVGGGSRLLGVLIAEQFKCDTFEPPIQDRLSVCCRHATTALANAVEMNSLPLLWLSCAIRSVAWLFGFQSIGTFTLSFVIAMHLLGVVVAALCLVPVDFTITARGELQPLNQQEVFAPADGVVEQLMVQHGNDVAQGDPLLQLRNTELDYEAERLRGEIATTSATLSTIQAARALDARDRQRIAQHNAEIQRYKQILTGLIQQQEILDRQRRELTVLSTIAGQVLSWEAEKALVSRPVRQGQRLMTIAQVQGPWQLKLDVPDEDIGHVLQAKQRTDETELPVTFILLTDPAATHRAGVADIALGTVIGGNREPAVHVMANVDSEELAAPRPGAGVVARIHCGRRSIGYVWLRGVYEQMRMRFMW